MAKENNWIAVGNWTFLGPIVGFFVALSVVDIVVPRERHAEFTAEISGARAFGANVGAAYYYLALATALVVVLCAVCLWYNAEWLARIYSSRLTRGQRQSSLAGAAIA